MKKAIALLLYCSIALLLLPVRVNFATAKEASPSASLVPPKDKSTLDKINLIKEKVASKVAQLNEKIQYASDGSIEKLEEGLFTFSSNGEEKTVNEEENTIFLIRNDKLTTQKGEFSDLEENDSVTVIGTEQIGTGIINAKLVVKTKPVMTFAGKVQTVNKKNFAFTVKEKDNEYTFDYEKYTKSFLLSKSTNKLAPTGFSSIEPDMNIQIMAIPQKDSETKFTALRLILIQ
jgi:hypothetical protein